MTDQPQQHRKKARTEADTAISRTVATNAARLRKARRLTRRALIQAIQANGHRMSEHTLGRIEIGHYNNRGLRAVTVDELVWIAEALGVGPDQLLATDPCPTCADTPPHRFTCKDCGAGADRE